MVAEPIHPLSFPMTEEEYLVFEEMSQDKHEYANGYIYAMSGGTSNHSAITTSVVGELYGQLLDKDCTVHSSDLKIHVAATRSYRYPDVSVVCGETRYAMNRTDLVTNPVLVVEVLSPSTARTDHHVKLGEYTQIDSLQAYLLISQDEPKVQRFLRQSSGDWLYTTVAGLEGTVELPFLDCTLALSRIYRRVTWEDA
jgi:Uma2 family endonuclease